MSSHRHTSFYIGESDDSDGETAARQPEPHHYRRASFSDDLGKPRQFVVNVRKTKERLLRQEDTDGDQRITIEDRGPKHVHLTSAEPSGRRLRHSVRGNYMVSNLLQELALLETASSSQGPSGFGKTSKGSSREHAVLHLGQISENPMDRLNRMIKKHFWPALVRRIDADGLSLICLDPKARTKQPPRIYVPHEDSFALGYYQSIATERPYLGLEVVQLPAQITPEHVKRINDHPGILCLDLECDYRERESSKCIISGKPFLVPGGRFNEVYGWDSYFIILGLLADEGSIQNAYLAKSIVDNLAYEINHYGMILNANRSYYLLRSQPPFLTDMAWRVYQRLVEMLNSDDPVQSTAAKGILSPLQSPQSWLDKIMLAAIREYESVWMSEPRLIPEIGLSRYCSRVRGIPPETEPTHFYVLLEPYAKAHGLTPADFISAYNEGRINEPALDEYFLHDRAVRESGHDTTYRLDGRAAHLVTVDLCSLLYKYETDLAQFVDELHGGTFESPDGGSYTAKEWRQAAERRKALADQYLWNEQKGLYFDYNFVLGDQITYESVTCLWPLWADMSSPEQAAKLIATALPLFEEAGGLVSGTKASLGDLTLSRPSRQWDYPYGWAPHQIMAWKGLCRYGHRSDVHRLVYRWLYMITRAFSDFNGVVPEKFDVVRMSHKVSAEYGNVGTDFSLVPREGFGWMNASYQIGQTYLSLLERRALGTLVSPDDLLKRNLLLKPLAKSGETCTYHDERTKVEQASREREKHTAERGGAKNAEGKDGRVETEGREDKKEKRAEGTGTQTATGLKK